MLLAARDVKRCGSGGQPPTAVPDSGGPLSSTLSSSDFTDTDWKRMLNNPALLQMRVDEDLPRHVVGGGRFGQLQLDDAADRPGRGRLHAQQLFLIHPRQRDDRLTML